MLLLLRRRRDDVVLPSEMKRGINSDMVKRQAKSERFLIKL